MFVYDSERWSWARLFCSGFFPTACEQHAHLQTSQSTQFSESKLTKMGTTLSTLSHGRRTRQKFKYREEDQSQEDSQNYEHYGENEDQEAEQELREDRHLEERHSQGEEQPHTESQKFWCGRAKCAALQASSRSPRHNCCQFASMLLGLFDSYLQVTKGSSRKSIIAGSSWLMRRYRSRKTPMRSADMERLTSSPILSWLQMPSPTWSTNLRNGLCEESRVTQTFPLGRERNILVRLLFSWLCGHTGSRLSTVFLWIISHDCCD